MPLISFDTPWKHQKTSVFLMFSGSIKRGQWHEMGWWQVMITSEQIYFLRSYENAEVLTNLKTDSNKNYLPLPISEEIQPLTKYFGTFLSVILVSFHLKWNRTNHYHYKLNARVTSRVVKRLKNKEILVKSGNWVDT